jgi:hypothetical protein
VAGLLAALGLVGFGGYIGTHVLTRDTKPSRASAGSIESTEPRSRAQERPATSGASATAGTRPGQTKPVQIEPLTAADRASFRRLERNLGGTSALAVSAIGLTPLVREVGTLQEAVAWSTIKVPIAMAVERRTDGHPTASEQSLLTRAITASDNSAAVTLWSSLGSPDVAAAAVQRILAETGDTSTRVETRVLRPGFTSFGQTQWSLLAQQRFIAGLPCLPNSDPVRSLMEQVVPDQRWGLGTLGADTQFKGGWGPEPDGRYLVRQMGIVRLAGGHSLAASMATMPADGTFATGTANLTEIAQWLIAHVDARRLSSSGCRL